MTVYGDILAKSLTAGGKQSDNKPLILEVRSNLEQFVWEVEEVVLDDEALKRSVTTDNTEY